MNIKSFLLGLGLIVFSIGFSGCSATGKLFEVEKINDGKAMVYIYRPSAFENSAIVNTWYISDSDKNMTRLGILENGGYLHYEMEAGQNNIIVMNDDMSQSTKTNILAVTLAPVAILGGVAQAVFGKDSVYITDYNLTAEAGATYCIRYTHEGYYDESGLLVDDNPNNGIVDLKTCLDGIKNKKSSHDIN